MMGGGMIGGGLGSFGLVGGLIGLLFNIAILVGIVVLVVWVVKQFGHSSNQATSATAGSLTGQPLSAREVLDTRYARGELTREEYQIILSDVS